MNKEEIKELSPLQKAIETSNEILDSYEKNPQKIADFLAFRARHNLYNYSVRNTVLIYNQNPGAMLTGSYQKWKEQGYHVLKGQKGLKILVPAQMTLFKPQNGEKYKKLSQATKQEKALIKSGQIQTFKKNIFVVGNVFDIAQTDFPKEKYPEIVHMGFSSQQHEQAYEAVKYYLNEQNISVKESDLGSAGLRGLYFDGTKSIEINHLLNDTEKLSTLCHEAGHAIFRHNQDDKTPESVTECQADAFGICLQSHLGIELTESRKAHFKGHFENCKNLEGFSSESLLKTVTEKFSAEWQQLEPHIENLLNYGQEITIEAEFTQQMC